MSDLRILRHSTTLLLFKVLASKTLLLFDFYFKILIPEIQCSDCKAGGRGNEGTIVEF